MSVDELLCEVCEWALWAFQVNSCGAAWVRGVCVAQNTEVPFAFLGMLQGVHLRSETASATSSPLPPRVLLVVLL